MSLGNYVSRDSEGAILRAKTAADQAFASGAATDAGTAARLVSIQKNYHWLSPGIQLSYAQSGYSGHSPEVHTAAQLDLTRKQRGSQFSDLLRSVHNMGDLKRALKTPGLSAGQRKQIAARGINEQLGTEDPLGLGSAQLDPGIDTGDVTHFVSRAAQGDFAGAIRGGSTPGTAGTRGELSISGVHPSDVTKTVTREAGALANTPLQYAQGAIRDAASGVQQVVSGTYDPTRRDPTQNPALQTDVGQQIDAAQHGRDPFALGSGYLPDPDSPIGRAQSAAARRAAPLVNGHAFTLGRYAGAQVFEPDSTGYNILSGVIDAAVTVKGDPGAALMRASSEARQAGRYFTTEPAIANTLAEDAGILASTQRLMKGTPTAFLDSPKNTPALQNFANTSSPSELWRLMGKNDAIPATVYEHLAAARTVEDVKAVVRPYMGTSIQPGAFNAAPGGLSYGFKRALDNHILGGLLPEPFFQPEDTEGSIRQLDRLMQGGHIPLDARRPILDRWITAGNQSEKYNALTAVSDVLKETMLRRGVPDEEAARLTRLFPESSELARSYDFNQITRTERLRPGVLIDGAGTPIPSPELTTEWMNSGFTLPDMRSVRRATTAIAPIVNHPAYSGSGALLDSFMNDIWKPAHLIRPALGLRVIADSQASLAANGFTSLFTHPIDYISAMIGGSLDKRWAQNAAKLIKPSYMFDGAGEPVIVGAEDDVARAIYGGWSGVQDYTKVALNEYKQVAREDPKYAEGLVRELLSMRGDPRVRGILQQDSPLAAKEWFWSGEGRTLRESFVQTARDLNDSHASAVAAGEAAGHIPLDFESRAGADAWVDAILARAHDATGGHPELESALRAGKFQDGTSLWRNNGPNDAALKRARELADEGVGPASIKAQSTIFLTRSDKLRQQNIKNRAVQWMFDHVLTLPDAEVDRIPAYQQSLWGSPQRVGAIERYLPYVEPADYDRLLRNAEENNLPVSVLSRLRSKALDGSTTERLPIDRLMKMARADAASNIPKLVHDLHTRSQFFDMTRLLFPFGDAFRRIAQRWATTVWENPVALYRAQQVVTGARQSGFFHKDPTTGEEVFTFPGSEWLTDKLIGVPIPLTGQAKGLSMIGEGYPGVGPAVTLPAQWFLPDTPQYDKIRDVIFPFGQPENASSKIFDVASTIMPPWLSKIIDGPPDQKTFNNTVGSMVNYLASTGGYNLHGPDATKETARLLHDAKDKAQWFYVIRGVAQATFPTSPAPQYQIKDASGHLQILNVVKNDYNTQLQKLGPDGALRWLIDNYGPNNLFIAQSFSKPLAYGVPITKEANDWARDNPGLRTKYPTTYGLFAPTGGKRDITAYEDQFTHGERVTLTPEEQTASANNRVGLWIYHNKRDQMLAANEKSGRLTLTKPQQEWLKGLKGALKKDYPGFDLQAFDINKFPKAVDELTRAASDPKLADTEAGQGLNTYLAIRARAIAEAKKSYKLQSPFRAAKAAPLRDWLRAAAEAVISDYPDFAPQWEQVWSHEMTADVAGSN